MISKELEQVLHNSIRDAKKRRHENVTVEHLFFALLYDEFTVDILENCGANIPILKKQMDKYLSTRMEILPDGIDEDPMQTGAFHRVMYRVMQHLRNANKNSADGGDVLIAILKEEESFAAYFLKTQEVTRFEILQYISHGEKINPGDISINHSLNSDDDKKQSESKSFLENFTSNLTEMAKNGEIDPVIGRSNELLRMFQVICRRRKNNPLLVGEPGVGKTAIAEGLAIKIIDKTAPEILHGYEVYSLDMGSLLAGTKFRGDFEQRLKKILKEIGRKKKSVLFIDEIHTLIGAGATSNGTMDASNLLKPNLASGKLRCIGATTFQEYRNVFLKDSALSRRFQKINVPEPSIQETFEILKGLKDKYEEHYKIKYTLPALKNAAELAQKFIQDRFLPDKAIDVIDEAGAACIIEKRSKRRTQVSVSDIERIVAMISHTPLKKQSANAIDALSTLELDLKQKIYGQEEAIESISTAIKRNKAGLGALTKPIGCFLFTGPTGVGKTELCKQLSAIMNIRFERIDMSEYMEKHSVARLIGAPPGYIGYDQGGLLTEAVKKNPHCVLLLDEIEKAHQDVYNILLQVMDHATLTDNNGTKIDFRHVVLIFTSNVGSGERGAKNIGFGTSNLGKEKQAVEKHFSPEFRNRLDAIINFKELTPDIMGYVVDKFIDELRSLLYEKKIKLILHSSAKKYLVQKGYTPEYGARPLERVIQTEIKDKLSEEILFGKLNKGGTVEIKEQKKELTFKFRLLGDSK